MKKNNAIILNDAALKKYNLTKKEFITLLCVNNRIELVEYESSLFKKRLVCDKDGVHYLSSIGKQLLESCMNDTTSDGISEEKIIELAKKLQAVYPEGKKSGTTYYWRGNVGEIVRKLKGFYKRYGTTYTDEEIISATERYIKSFSNSTAYMQLLKYFIWKEKENGEEISELAAYLENVEQKQYNSDWETTLK